MIIPYEVIYFASGFVIALITLILLYVVYILRIYHKKSTSSDLQQIKSIIENNTYIPTPKYKLIKGIEVIDLDDQETDTKGNDK